MAGFTEILASLLVKRAPAPKRQPSVKQMLNMAFTRSGKRGHRTWRRVAADLGVAESTLRRWRHGEHISARKLRHLQDVTAAARGAIRRRRPPADSAVTITWSFDGRTRDTTGSSLRLAPGTLKAVQSHLMAGREQQATKTFMEGIGDPWYQSHWAAWQASEEAKAIEKAKETDDDDEEYDYEEYEEEYYDELYYEDSVVDDDDYFDGAYQAH